MIDHIFTIIGSFALLLLLIATYLFVKLMLHMSDEMSAMNTDTALNIMVTDAVLAIEEEARTTAPCNKPTSAQKRELAVGFITRMLDERKMTVPLDIIVGKVDATVHRLFNNERK